MAATVLFITGTSPWFTLMRTKAALARGDKVAAADLRTAPLAKLSARYGDDVLPMRIDPTDPAAIDAALARAEEFFGHVDEIVTDVDAAGVRELSLGAVG